MYLHAHFWSWTFSVVYVEQVQVCIKVAALVGEMNLNAPQPSIQQPQCLGCLTRVGLISLLFKSVAILPL